MAVGASITVNTGRIDGNVDSGASSEEAKVLKQILSELKKNNKQDMVQQRKKESGIISQAGPVVGAIMAALGLSGIPIAMASEAGKKARANYDVSKYGDFEYAKIVGDDGVQKVAQIDKESGEIVQLLEMQVARQMNIVDNIGNIQTHKASQETIEKSILKSLAMSGDAYMMSNDLQWQITQKVVEQAKIQDTINQLLRSIKYEREQELIALRGYGVKAKVKDYGQYEKRIDKMWGIMNNNVDSTQLYIYDQFKAKEKADNLLFDNALTKPSTDIFDMSLLNGGSGYFGGGKGG